MNKEDMAYTHYEMLLNHNRMHTATCMGLHIIILCLKCQIEKDKYHMISLSLWNLKREGIYVYLWLIHNVVCPVEEEHVEFGIFL